MLNNHSKVVVRLTLGSFRLGLGVLQDFNQLRPDTQLKNITAWTPVVAEMLQGFVKLDDKAVSISRFRAPR